MKHDFHIRISKLWAIAVVALVLSVSTLRSNAGIYSISFSSPIASNVGKSLVVQLNANMVKDQYATGAVSGTITYNPKLLFLVYVHNVNYPQTIAYTWDKTKGTITLSAPSLGAGKGHGGKYTLTEIGFTTLATGPATFQAATGSLVVNGTSHTVVPFTSTIYTASCPTGQTGTPPNCTTTTPTPPQTCPSGQQGTPPNCTTSVTPQPVPAPQQQTQPVQTDEYIPDESSEEIWYEEDEEYTEEYYEEYTDQDISESLDGEYYEESFIDESIDASEEFVDIGTTESSNGDGSSQNTPTQNKDISLSKSVVKSLTAAFTFLGTIPLSDAQLRFGTERDAVENESFLTANDKTLNFTLEKLRPSTKYFYSVTGKKPSGEIVKYDSSFVTQGYPIKMILLSGTKPLANEKLLLNKKIVNTDSKGVLSARVEPGKSFIAYADGSHAKKFYIKRATPKKGSVELPVQTYQVKMTVANTQTIIIGLLLAVFFIGSTYLFKRHKNAHAFDYPDYTPGLVSPTNYTMGMAPVKVVEADASLASEQSRAESSAAPQPPNASSLEGQQPINTPTEPYYTPALKNPPMTAHQSLADIIRLQQKPSSRELSEDFDPFLQNSPFAKPKK